MPLIKKFYLLLIIKQLPSKGGRLKPQTESPAFQFKPITLLQGYHLAFLRSDAPSIL